MIKALGLLLVLSAAAALEAGGDAAIRQGLRGGIVGSGLVIAGAALLVGYSVLLAQAPVDFGRVIGLYVGVFFVFGQILNLVVFRTLPGAGIWLGGALIAVGAGVTMWLGPR